MYLSKPTPLQNGLKSIERGEYLQFVYLAQSDTNWVTFDQCIQPTNQPTIQPTTNSTAPQQQLRVKGQIKMSRGQQKINNGQSYQIPGHLWQNDKNSPINASLKQQILCINGQYARTVIYKWCAVQLCSEFTHFL